MRGSMFNIKKITERKVTTERLKVDVYFIKISLTQPLILLHMKF